MTWGIALVGLLLAAAAGLVIVCVLVWRSRGAVGDVFIQGGADMDTGNIGTGTSDFHREPYPTILAEHVPSAPNIQCELVLRDLHSGSTFKVMLDHCLPLGRGPVGRMRNGVLGIGPYNTVSHQQMLLQHFGDQLVLSNTSPKVMASCNGTPLYEPVSLKAGDVLQAGGAKVQILQFRCVNILPPCIR